MRNSTSDTPFEVKLGRIRSASGHTRMKSFFKKVGKARVVSHARQGQAVPVLEDHKRARPAITIAA